MVLPLIIGMVLGAIVGLIAEQKNRPFFPWAIYGFCFFFVAIIHIAVIGDKKYEDMELEGFGFVKCPACAELISGEASACKHCKASLEGKMPVSEARTAPAVSGKHCRWCKQEYKENFGNKCPACGGLQIHFLRDNPVLIVLIFCLLVAFFILAAQESQNTHPPSTPSDESIQFSQR